MVSTYQYITLANLEDKSGIDYSVVDATAFTDTKVEAVITIAERMVNAYLGVSTGQTKTDGVITATILISERMMHDNMVALGYTKEDAVRFDTYIDSIMEKWLKGDQDVMIDSIPMSGASYHRPDYRMFL